MKWTIKKNEHDRLSEDEQKFFSKSEFSTGSNDPPRLASKVYRAHSSELVTAARTAGYEIWVTYANYETGDETRVKFPQLKRAARRKYEILCGGFLHFYDEELPKYTTKFNTYLQKINSQNPSTSNMQECAQKLEGFFKNLKEFGSDHKIFFEWVRKGGNRSVRIFINPPAGNPDPPTPPPPPPPETFDTQQIS